MTARDDYPWLREIARGPLAYDADGAQQQAKDALDEIDRLRTSLNRYGPVSRSQDERRP